MGTEYVVIIWFGTYAEGSYVCVCVDLFRCNFEIGRAANFTSISSWRKVFQWSGFVSFPQMEVAGFFSFTRLVASVLATLGSESAVYYVVSKWCRDGHIENRSFAFIQQAVE